MLVELKVRHPHNNNCYSDSVKQYLYSRPTIVCTAAVSRHVTRITNCKEKNVKRLTILVRWRPWSMLDVSIEVWILTGCYYFSADNAFRAQVKWQVFRYVLVIIYRESIRPMTRFSINTLSTNIFALSKLVFLSLEHTVSKTPTHCVLCTAY